MNKIILGEGNIGISRWKREYNDKTTYGVSFFQLPHPQEIGSMHPIEEAGEHLCSIEFADVAGLDVLLNNLNFIKLLIRCENQ